MDPPDQRPGVRCLTMRIDLDAARRARAEARQDTHEFVFDGETFGLPAEMPLEFAYLLEDDVKDALRCLLGEQFDKFWACGPTKDDFRELASHFREVYGFGRPESSASKASSNNGGTPSRPTSRGTTKQTSAKRASARRR